MGYVALAVTGAAVGWGGGVVVVVVVVVAVVVAKGAVVAALGGDEFAFDEDAGIAAHDDVFGEGDGLAVPFADFGG